MFITNQLALLNCAGGATHKALVKSQNFLDREMYFVCLFVCLFIQYNIQSHTLLLKLLCNITQGIQHTKPYQLTSNVVLLQQFKIGACSSRFFKKNYWLGQNISENKQNHLEILEVFGHLSKMVNYRTNNGNTQVLGFLLSIKSSSAKIRVPDPLLVSTLACKLQNICYMVRKCCAKYFTI